MVQKLNNIVNVYEKEDYSSMKKCLNLKVQIIWVQM